MAVIKVAQGSRLVLTVQSGSSASGQPQYRQRIYKGVKAGAADADVYATAQTLVNLQKCPLAMVIRLDEANLLNG